MNKLITIVFATFALVFGPAAMAQQGGGGQDYGGGGGAAE